MCALWRSIFMILSQQDKLYTLDSAPPLRRSRRLGLLQNILKKVFPLLSEGKSTKQLDQRRYAAPTLSYIDLNNNNFRVSNIRVSNRTLIYNVCPEAALT